MVPDIYAVASFNLSVQRGVTPANLYTVYRSLESADSGLSSAFIRRWQFVYFHSLLHNEFLGKAMYGEVVRYGCSNHSR